MAEVKTRARTGCCDIEPTDPCVDCPAAHPNLEEYCADCEIGECEMPLAEVPRYGGNVFLCEACHEDEEARRPEEYRNAR